MCAVVPKVLKFEIRCSVVCVNASTGSKSSNTVFGLQLALTAGASMTSPFSSSTPLTSLLSVRILRTALPHSTCTPSSRALATSASVSARLPPLIDWPASDSCISRFIVVPGERGAVNVPRTASIDRAALTSSDSKYSPRKSRTGIGATRRNSIMSCEPSRRSPSARVRSSMGDSCSTSRKFNGRCVRNREITGRIRLMNAR